MPATASQRPHPDAHVPLVGPGEREPQQHRADQHADGPAGGAHSSHQPIEDARHDGDHERERRETDGEARPKVPACSAMSFTSTIGPTTMNASRAVSENCGEARGDERVGLGADRP